MKTNCFYVILFFTFLGSVSACKNKITPPPIHGDVLPSAPPENNGASEVTAGGCLEGNEVRAGGKILEGGKPPAHYAIHLFPTIDAEPIVVAKDLTFNPDGSFKFKGKLPDGAPLNFREKGGDIRIVWGGSRASIYSGDCYGKEYEEQLVDHSVFDKKDTSESKDIEIECDEKGNMMWGDIPIKDVNDFKKKMTADLQNRKKKGILSNRGLGFSMCPDRQTENVNKMQDVFTQLQYEILNSDEKSPNKGDKGDKGDKKSKPKPKPKPASALQVTQYENGTIKLKGKTVRLENLRKELQAVLLTYKVIPNKVPRVSVGTVGMGMRQEVQTIIDESIAGAKWIRKKAAMEASTAVKENSPKKETVQFAKGKSNAALTRTINPVSTIDFSMYAKKGQTISFTIGYDFKDSDIEGFLTEPGLQDISLTTGPKSPNEFKVNTSGNHRLTVHNYSKKKITRTLYLDIK
jgi:biopolymer transport protein ExbD